MKFLLTIMIFFSQLTLASVLHKSAPDFELKGDSGKVYKLSDYKGKWIVLEWFNQGCPFVKKHYKSGNMQMVQQYAKDNNIVWFTMASSAEGKQGYISGPEAIDELRKDKDYALKSTAVLLDSDGHIGRKYGAKVTPHMYIINPEGLIVYDGAIDSDSSANPSAILNAKNYVKDAIKAISNNEKITKNKTNPYGCSIKYK